MRFLAIAFTTGVLFSSALAVALVGFPVSTSGVLLTPTPTPTIPETLQQRCAAQAPGVWVITDEPDYLVGAPVHVALCNRLDVPITTRLIDDPLAPLLHLEQRIDAAWLPLFDVTVIFEDNDDVNQAATTDQTPYAQLAPDAVVLVVLVPPQEPESVAPGGPYVSPPVSPILSGPAGDLASPLPWNPLTPTRIVPRDGRPVERQAATPTATLAVSEPLAHTVTLQHALNPGIYRLLLDYRKQAASEFEATYSTAFVIDEASEHEVPQGEDTTP